MSFSTNIREPFYVAGGTLRPGSASYVTRQADEEIYERLLRGEFCYVLTARQMGKSSLIAATAKRLETKGARTAVVDLTRIGKERGAIQSEQWYFGVAHEIHRQLGIISKLRPWWQARMDLPALQRLVEFFREMVLKTCAGRIVVVIDEIDSTIGLPFADDFFAAVRACYNARSSEPEFVRIAFVLVGVASPDQLIRDSSRTPFNIGQRVELTDFSVAESGRLAERLNPDPEIAGERLARILYWTAGHPYLTQALCRAVEEGEADAAPAVEMIDQIVEQLFLSSRAQREETNLKYARARLTAGEASDRPLLRFYLQILRGGARGDGPASPRVTQLKLTGIVKVSDDGRLVVRNRIYEAVFTAAWARSELPTGNIYLKAAAALLMVGLLVYATAQKRQSESFLGKENAARDLAAQGLRAAERLNRQGKDREANEQLDQALRLLNSQLDDRGGATGHNALGLAWLEASDLSMAKREFTVAIALAVKAGDKRAEAIAASNIGRIARIRGELRLAAEAQRRALSSYRELNDLQGIAAALLELGSLANDMAQRDQARDVFGEVFAMARRRMDPQLEAAARLGLARTSFGAGGFMEAEVEAQKALAILEALRGKQITASERLAGPDLLRDGYDFYIDLLMAQNLVKPAAGYDRRAFEISERSRVPELIDAAVNRRRGQVPLANQIARKRIIDELNKATIERLQLRFTDSVDQRNLASRRVAVLTKEYESLETSFSPSREGEHPPDLSDAMSVLDERSALLEFHLGERRSFLWVLSKQGFSSFELPPRAFIEDMVRAAYAELVSPRASRNGAPHLQRLGQLILGPLKMNSKWSRLLIASDGALEQIPFAALPEPNTRDVLLRRYEIINIPSIWSVLAMHDADKSRRTEAGIAGIVDPVFSADDERARGTRSPRGGFNRLPATRIEGNAIHAIGPRQHLIVSGFPASRELVMSGELQGYGVLHFATHFIVDSEHPALSSIVLSLIDSTGRPIDGLVRAYEISGLPLSARLIVLSGSKTMLGWQAGSGMKGLSESFLATGVPQVIGSLWDVDDLSTARLMEQFYRNLFSRGLPAESALREAQLKLLNQPMSKSPFYWAAFVVEGDWSGRVAKRAGEMKSR